MTPSTFATSGRLGRLASRGAAAAAEALFPKNNLGAPDWESAEVVPRLEGYLGELPPRSRRLILLLFTAVELWPLLALRVRRFSRLRPEARLGFVRRWRASRLYPIRLIGESTKAVLTMMYLSHPEALRYIGAYTVSPRPGDGLEVKKERLAVLSAERGPA